MVFTEGIKPTAELRRVRPTAMSAAMEARLVEAFPEKADYGLVVSNPQHCGDCEELAKDLGGRTWRTISAETVRRHCSGLSLLTEPAFVALLPAWLREAIRAPEELVADSVFMALSSVQLYPQRPSPFTAPQREIILLVAHALATADRMQEDEFRDRMGTIQGEYGART